MKKIKNKFIILNIVLIYFSLLFFSNQNLISGNDKRNRFDEKEFNNKRVKQDSNDLCLPIEIELYIINLAIYNIIESNSPLDPLKGVNNFIGKVRLIDRAFNSFHKELLNNANKKAKSYFSKEYDKYSQKELNDRLNYLLNYYYQQTLTARKIINIADNDTYIPNISSLLGFNWTDEEQLEMVNRIAGGNFGPLVELEIAKLIIAGADPNINLILDNSTEIISPLILIAKTSIFTNLIKVLVDYGANINFQDKNGETPLIHAAKNGRKEIVDILTALKCDANIIDNDGFTALTTALTCNTDLDIANLLIAHGADVNIVKEGFPSTLIVVADSEDNLYKQVEFLLNNGANIDFQDADGNTALIYAVQQGLADIVQILVVYNANINLTNAEGLSAIDFASNKQNIINIIEKYNKE